MRYRHIQPQDSCALAQDSRAEVAEDPKHSGVTLEHVCTKGMDAVRRGRAAEQAEEESANSATLVGVDHGHGDLGHLGLGREPDVAGHADPRFARERGIQGDPGHVIRVIDFGEVAKLVELEEPDLVLLDLVLPGTSGFELLQRIREFSGSKSGVLPATATLTG